MLAKCPTSQGAEKLTLLPRRIRAKSLDGLPPPSALPTENQAGNARTPQLHYDGDEARCTCGRRFPAADGRIKSTILCFSSQDHQPGQQAQSEAIQRLPQCGARRPSPELYVAWAHLPQNGVREHTSPPPSTQDAGASSTGKLRSCQLSQHNQTSGLHTPRAPLARATVRDADRSDGQAQASANMSELCTTLKPEIWSEVCSKHTPKKGGGHGYDMMNRCSRKYSSPHSPLARHSEIGPNRSIRNKITTPGQPNLTKSSRRLTDVGRVQNNLANLAPNLFQSAVPEHLQSVSPSAENFGEQCSSMSSPPPPRRSPEVVCGACAWPTSMI